MPIVPTYGPRKVLTAALPPARKTAAETELSAGVGVEAGKAQLALAKGRGGQLVAQAVGSLVGPLSQLGDVMMRERIRIQEEETERVGDIVGLRTQRVLAEWEHKTLYDPEKGALTRRGMDAFGLPEEIAKDYAKVTGALAATLTTDRQREAFAKMASARAINLDLTIRRYVSGELQRVEAEEVQATVVNARNAAIANASDPRRVGMELGTAVQAIRTHGKDLGLGPEGITQQVEAVTTQVHVGVIESLLAQQFTKAAQVYFDETKDQITGEAITHITKALKEGTVRKQAQDHADAIIGAGGTLAQQEEKARKIDDREVRDQVIQRLEHEAAKADKRERDVEEQNLRRAYDIVERTGSVDGIDPALRSRIAEHMPGLRAAALARARGVPVETDWALYYTLMRKAGQEPRAFIEDDLLKHGGLLGEVEFKQLTSLQLAMRQGDTRTAAQDIGSFQTKSQVLEGALTAFGIDPTPGEGTRAAKAIAQLRRMLDVSVEDQERLSGKKATSTDMTRMLDEILYQSITIPGGWLNMFPGGRPFWDKEKRLIDATIEDIPTEERKTVERALREKGRPVTEVTILDYWLEHKVRGIR